MISWVDAPPPATKAAASDTHQPRQSRTCPHSAAPREQGLGSGRPVRSSDVVRSSSDVVRSSSARVEGARVNLSEPSPNPCRTHPEPTTGLSGRGRDAEALHPRVQTHDGAWMDWGAYPRRLLSASPIAATSAAPTPRRCGSAAAPTTTAGSSTWTAAAASTVTGWCRIPSEPGDSRHQPNGICLRGHGSVFVGFLVSPGIDVAAEFSEAAGRPRRGSTHRDT